LENGEEGRLRRRKKFDGENKARGRTCGTKGIFQKLVEKRRIPRSETTQFDITLRLCS
jgi:hypothetical protein